MPRFSCLGWNSSKLSWSTVSSSSWLNKRCTYVQILYHDLDSREEHRSLAVLRGPLAAATGRNADFKRLSVNMLSIIAYSLVHRKLKFPQNLLRWPDLSLKHLLACIVFSDDFPMLLLESKRPLFQPRVHFTIDKNACVEILLCHLTKNLVFADDLLVKLMYSLEILFCRVFISENLVMHSGTGRSMWQKSLKHNEVRPMVD